MTNWYKRDPVDALDGMARLTLEEIGAYNVLLDTIYRDGRGIDDDERYVAGILRVSIRRWRRLRERLLAAEKLVIENGRVHNSRAIDELKNRQTLSEKRRASGKIGGVSRKTGRSEGQEPQKPAGPGEAIASTPSSQSRVDKSRVEENTPLPPSPGGGLFAEDSSGSDPPAKPKLETEFEESFWPVYPKRERKKEALRSFRSARKRAKLEAICSAAGRFAADVTAKGTAKNFIAAASVWLNNDRWVDYGPEFSPAAGSANGTGTTALDQMMDQMLAENGGEMPKPVRPRWEQDISEVGGRDEARTGSELEGAPSACQAGSPRRERI